MMALPNLCRPCKTPTIVAAAAKPRLSILPSSKNPSPPFFLSLGSPPRRERIPAAIRCSGIQGGDYEHERVVHPRPQEIPWSKEIANSVRLIGIIGAPVQIKHLSSGKVLAWTRIAVKKSPSETSWINLTFWDELAQVAFQHVEKGQQVYVSGRLVMDTVEGEDEKRQVYYKVVVQQLNFIERSFPEASQHEPESGSMGLGAKFGSNVANNTRTTTELWQAFFANPLDWWDNRMNKRNPKAPDFKHKDTGEALWIEGKNNPSWVKSQLAILDARMSSFQPNGTKPAASFLYGDDFKSF